ncbi:MAG: glycosyltransferase [Nitrospiraceae bacterium]|nr:MAG: glycosyltransferase [Nitrospiraceae bacterium]
MTVLHINKLHYIFGGADVIYFRTAEILEKNGHSSVFFAMRHPDNLPCHTAEYFMPLIDTGKRYVSDFVKASCRNIYSFKARKCISRILDKYHIDIVHMHDIHRQMSPSILHEIKKREIPVVMTLHNYKMICPSFLMMAHGKPCEACDQGKYFNAVKLKCVKGSFFRSALLAIELYMHHKILDAYKNVNVFIAPSIFLKNKHEEMGFHKNIVHLPYPLDVKGFDKVNPEEIKEKTGGQLTFVYFGRLEPEKGLFTLFESIKNISYNEAESRVVFKIIGEGAIKDELHEIALRNGMHNVEFLGYLTGEDLFTEIRKADVVIIPSEWYENYPVSVMEAFALGKPVIGARIGGIPEMVKDNATGLTFESGDPSDLGEKITYVIKNPGKAALWGRNAREFIEREVNPEKHYRQLMKIYNMAMSHR